LGIFEYRVVLTHDLRGQSRPRTVQPCQLGLAAFGANVVHDHGPEGINVHAAFGFESYIKVVSRYLGGGKGTGNLPEWQVLDKCNRVELMDPPSHGGDGTPSSFADARRFWRSGNVSQSRSTIISMSEPNALGVEAPENASL
jgi:hypothetical protein